MRQRRLPGCGCGEERRQVEGRQRRRGHARDTAPPLGEEAPRPAPVAVRQVMEGDRDLDHALERLALGARRRLPHRLENLVHLEEEPLVPQRGGDAAGACDPGAERAAPERLGSAASARRVDGHGGRVRRVNGEERAAAGVDQVHGRQARRGRGRRLDGGGSQPRERGRGPGVVAGGERQLRERVAERERKSGCGQRVSPLSSASPMC